MDVLALFFSHSHYGCEIDEIGEIHEIWTRNSNK